MSNHLHDEYARLLRKLDELAHTEGIDSPAYRAIDDRMHELMARYGHPDDPGPLDEGPPQGRRMAEDDADDRDEVPPPRTPRRGDRVITPQGRQGTVSRLRPGLVDTVTGGPAGTSGVVSGGLLTGEVSQHDNTQLRDAKNHQAYDYDEDDDDQPQTPAPRTPQAGDRVVTAQGFPRSVAQNHGHVSTVRHADGGEHIARNTSLRDAKNHQHYDHAEGQRLWVYDCPECGGPALNGDVVRRTKYRGSARCTDCGHSFSCLGCEPADRNGPSISQSAPVQSRQPSKQARGGRMAEGDQRDFGKAQTAGQAKAYQGEQDRQRGAEAAQRPTEQPEPQEPVQERAAAPVHTAPVHTDPMLERLIGSANLGDPTDRAMLSDELEEAGRIDEARHLRSRRRLEVGEDGRVRQAIEDRKEHNGWTNYTTWNLASRLHNDERAYRATNSLFEKNPQADSHDIERLVRRIYPTGELGWYDVNWEEIFDAFRPEE